MDQHTMATTARSRRRPTAPKPVRQVARAARLSLEEFAEAVVAGQPRPERPREHAALLHWLGHSVRNAYPGAPTDELAGIMAARLQEMADGGDATAKALLEADVREHVMDLVRISLALVGGLVAPDPPAVPKRQRIDAIASTVLQLTGWSSVVDDTVQAVYRWLFGDEALFLIGTEMRVEAGKRILEDPRLGEVHVPHPETGELVLVTRAEIREHGADDLRVLEAAYRYSDQQVGWHSCLIRSLEPYAEDGMSVGDVLNRAAADLGIEATGRDPEELAELVMAASGAEAEVP